MEELKPCPFCGCKFPKITGQRFWLQKENDNYGNPVFAEHISYEVSCGNFCCKLNQKFKSKEEAIEAWNRRAE